MIKNKKVILYCFIIAFIFCIPMFKGSIRLGPDTTFHINRIISLKNAILNGDFFPRILFAQNYNFGYGSPLFYSIIFLYPSALLLLFNIPIYVVYYFTIFFIVFFSCFNMYHCCRIFYKKENNIYILISVFVYVVNLFFISNIYKRGAIGEGFAYIFLPIVVKAIYEIVYLNKKDILLLVVGFSGLLLAHNITFILMCIIFMFILFIEHKKIIRNYRIIIYIVIASVFSVFITCFFTFPMFEQLSLKLYRINYYFNTDSIKGIDFKELFYFYNGDGVYLNNSIGPILLLLPLTIVFVKNKMNKFIKILFIFSYVMIFMTLKYFPWNLFKFMSFLQFPERLLTIVCCFMSISLGYILSKQRLIYINYIALIVILITSIFHVLGVISEYGQIKYTHSEKDLSNVELFTKDKYWYNTLEISSPDYIYQNAAIDFKNYGYILKTNNEDKDKTVFDRSKYNSLIFTVGSIKKDAYYIIPISYYKGYVVDIFEDESYLKTVIPTYDNETGLIRINLEEYNSNKLLKFVCYYKKTNIQIISENISKVSLIIFIVYMIILKSKINKWIVATVNKKHKTNS